MEIQNIIRIIFFKNELRPFLKSVFWRKYVGIFQDFLSRSKPLKKISKDAVSLTPGGMEIQNKIYKMAPELQNFHE